MKKKLHWIRIIFCFVFLFGLLGKRAEAENEPEKTLRVGFSPEGIFMIGDENEPKSGYGYEYLQRIAGYGGWKYEYVYTPFPKQLEMLKEGNIDIVVNVSYTEERTEWMNFSEVPMGEENYYICSKKGTDIVTDDLSSLEGKRIGATKNSYQLTLLKEWIEKNGISCTVVETDGGSPEDGVDAYVTMDIYSIGDWNPLFKIGSSEYYFGLNKENPGLAEAFNQAQRAVLEVSPYYQDELHSRYFGSILVNEGFNIKEEQWLKEHGEIRLGYYDNYLPFSDHSRTGEISGYLSSVLTRMEKYLSEYGGRIKTVPYSSMEELKRDLAEGELQMIYPVHRSFWKAEEEGFLLSDSLEELQMSVVYKEVSQEQRYDSIAITSNDPFQESYVTTNYPKAQLIYYPNLEECVRAVDLGRANCTMISSLMAEQMTEKFKQLKVFGILEDTQLGFGIEAGQTELLSMVNRMLHQLPKTILQESLVEYAEENSHQEIIKRTRNLFLLAFAFVLLLLGIMLLYLEIVRRRALRQKAVNNEIIDILGTVVEYRSLESGQHVKRVKGFTKILGNYILREHPEYGLTKQQLEIIVSASALHDVGKVAISDEILLKPGKLTPEEYEIMKEHTVKGSDILNHLYNIMEPEYARISHEICRYHHERFDGRGYPERLKGDDIPISAQLVSIADVYDALTNERCYKAAFSAEEAFQMILEGQCGSFSPKLLEGLKNTKEEFIRCSQNYK